MKIATWNVNGIRAREAQVVEWLARDEPDIVCLQEVKATPEQVPPSLASLDAYWSVWHGGKGYSGVALLVRKAVAASAPRFVHPDFDFETRIVSAEVEGLDVASVYVPNGGKDFEAKMRFLEALERHAADAAAAGRRLILCGDMNVTRTDQDVHPKERKPGVIGQRPDERALFERVIGRGLVDVGRALDPDNDQMFTWWAPWRGMRQRNIGWRLDYVLASESVAVRVSACPVLASVGTSDHAPVMATL